jgi:2-amino-4-hydroxy-6-hydroxymethyldihydropteridine diphosphokinase
LVSVSSVYETKAWGVEDQPDFLNAVCIVDDPGRDHWDWLRLGQSLEDAGGRVRELRWGPRTLDVDVVSVDEVRSADPELLLPHPGAGERATVLIPWLEIDPSAWVLDLGSAAGLLAGLPESDRGGVRLRPDLTL